MELQSHDTQLPVSSLSLPQRTEAGSVLERLQTQARCPSTFRHPFRFLWWLGETLFAWTGWILFLAILTAIPPLNFIALGYLLDAEGRVGRSGRFRDGFPMRPFIPRISSLTLGILLICLSLWILNGFARDAAIIAPDSGIAHRWNLFITLLATLLGLHLFGVLAWGGTWGSFFRPLRNWRWILHEARQLTLGQTLTEAVLDFVRELRLGHHFWLGFLGYLSTFLWLAGPTALFASLRSTEGFSGLIVISGGILLVPVLSWVPFLQAQLAIENHWRSAFDLQRIRLLSGRTPWCWLLVTVLTYLLSLPLYLTTIVLPPRDAAWIVNLLFVLCIYPARLCVGWAYFQANSRRSPANVCWRWTATPLLLLLLAIYVFLLYFSQLIGQHGKLVLFEHPALLFPVAF